MIKNIFPLLLFFTNPVIANPVCNYNFQVSNSTIQLAETSQVLQQTIMVNRGQNSPDGRCRTYRVFFGKGLANAYQRQASSAGKSLNYNLHPFINKQGILKDFNDAINSNEFIQGSAPDKLTTYTNHFFVAAPSIDEANIPSGTYSDIVQVTIYGLNESNSTYLFEQTLNMTFLFNVPKKITVGLSDENGPFDSSSTTKVMDFGVLSQGSKRAVDLRVVSNTPYQIKISSLNNGKIKSSENFTIDYQLRSNGKNVNLLNTSGNPATIGSGSTTNSMGDRFNLNIEITGPTQNMPAGLYQDSITITAVAN